MEMTRSDLNFFHFYMLLRELWEKYSNKSSKAKRYFDIVSEIYHRIILFSKLSKFIVTKFFCFINITATALVYKLQI